LDGISYHERCHETPENTVTGSDGLYRTVGSPATVNSIHERSNERTWSS